LTWAIDRRIRGLLNLVSGCTEFYSLPHASDETHLRCIHVIVVAMSTILILLTLLQPGSSQHKPARVAGGNELAGVLGRLQVISAMKGVRDVQL
jgi:hypothetical protein